MSDNSVYSVPDDISGEHRGKYSVQFGSVTTPVELLNIPQENTAPIQASIRKNYYLYFKILKSLFEMEDFE